MRKIIYERADGGVAVVTPVRNTFPRVEDLSDAEVEQRAWDRLPADAISPAFIEASDLPTDRSFRDAWVRMDSGVHTDMARAREIHRDRLRMMRAPLLQALDIEYQRADETGDAAKKNEIAMRKQALRDVTNDPAIDAAETPESLKAAVPEILLP